jgi:hypothetical protein
MYRWWFREHYGVASRRKRTHASPGTHEHAEQATDQLRQLLRQFTASADSDPAVAADLEALFDEFRQLDATTRGAGQSRMLGTGLGR